MSLSDTILGVAIGMSLWTLFAAIFGYLRFFGISLIKWKLLEECPFLISSKEETCFKLDKKSRLIKSRESVDWVISLCEAILIDERSMIREYLGKVIEGRSIDTHKAFGSILDAIRITRLHFQPNPGCEVMISPSIPDDDSDTFVIGVDAKFGGNFLVEASGNSSALAQTVDIGVGASSFNGRLMLGFGVKDSGIVLISSTAVPEISFDFTYGEQQMPRLANLALLVLKSLLNSHLLHPNCLPIILRAKAKANEPVVALPISVFNPCFLKFQALQLFLTPQFIEEYPLISCTIQFNGQKVKFDTSPSSICTTWKETTKFPITFPLSTDAELPLYVRISGKKKKSTQSVLIEEMECSVEYEAIGCIRAFRHPLKDHPNTAVTFETILVSPDLCKTILPYGKSDLRPDSSKYINGRGWSNLKKALQSLVVAGERRPTSPMPDVPSIMVEEEKDDEGDVLERLHFYEDQIVQVLKFLADHESEADPSFAEIQTSLEAFRADITGMIQDYPNSSRTVDEVGKIIQSFVSLVSKKISNLPADDLAKDVLHPIDTHLKTLLSTEDLSACVSDAQSPHDRIPLDKPVYVHDNMVASAPELNLQAVEKFSSSEFLCHLGPVAVSFMLGDESLVVDDLHQAPVPNDLGSITLVSLLDADGMDLSMASIEMNQFAKRWIFTIEGSRLQLTLANSLPYFPYTCIHLDRLLKVKAYVPKSADKAASIEFYYLQDDELNVVEYLKYYGEPGAISKIYDTLQPSLLFTGKTCEIQYCAIEKLELADGTLTLILHPVYEMAGSWEAVRFSRFFGIHDVHDAYCDLQSRLHMHVKGGSLFSPTSGSGSQSPANTSNSNLSTVMAETGRRTYPNIHLFRPNVPKITVPYSKVLLSQLGLVVSPESIVEFSCSYLRRGVNFGRLFLAPDGLCFVGKRNGVRTSKLFIRWSCIEALELETRWFSRGFKLKFEDAPDPYFFFGFRKDSMLECYHALLGHLNAQFQEDAPSSS